MDWATPDPTDGTTDQALSALLRTLTEGEGESLPLEEVVDRFGDRAFGALLFVFAIPNLLPLPPGSTTILGLPLLIISPQLTLGVPRIWLPRSIGQRRIGRRELARAINRLIPKLVIIERLLKPRLHWMFGAVGDRLIGAVCTVLALVLILPIPLGNVLPALTISTLSLGLAQRDGVAALIGYALAAASAAVLALSFSIVVAAAYRLAHLLGA